MLTEKHARRALAPHEYDFTVTHRAGKTHQNADVPSKHPQVTTADIVWARLDSKVVSMSPVQENDLLELVFEDDDVVCASLNSCHYQ